MECVDTRTTYISVLARHNAKPLPNILYALPPPQYEVEFCLHGMLLFYYLIIPADRLDGRVCATKAPLSVSPGVFAVRFVLQKYESMRSKPARMVFTSGNIKISHSKTFDKKKHRLTSGLLPLSLAFQMTSEFFGTHFRPSLQLVKVEC